MKRVAINVIIAMDGANFSDVKENDSLCGLAFRGNGVKVLTKALKEKTRRPARLDARPPAISAAAGVLFTVLLRGLVAICRLC